MPVHNSDIAAICGHGGDPRAAQDRGVKPDGNPLFCGANPIAGRAAQDATDKIGRPWPSLGPRQNRWAKGAGDGGV
jgi:hypothetical protein